MRHQIVLTIIAALMAGRSMAAESRSPIPPQDHADDADARKITDEYFAGMTLAEKVRIIHGDGIYHNAALTLVIPE